MTPTHEHTDQKEHAETMNDDSYQYIDDREGCGLSRPRGPAGVVGERSGDNDTQVTVTCCSCCCGALANYCQASCFIAATRNRPGQRAHRPRPTKTTVIGLSTTRSSSWHRSRIRRRSNVVSCWKRTKNDDAVSFVLLAPPHAHSLTQKPM